MKDNFIAVYDLILSNNHSSSMNITLLGPNYRYFRMNNAVLFKIMAVISSFGRNYNGPKVANFLDGVHNSFV